MATPLIGEELKHLEQTHGGSLNYWVGNLINVPIQKMYDLQYLPVRLSAYMNAPTEPGFLVLNHGIE